MPVKVRCSGCEKVLNAPDAARGKSIKCPSCQGKVKVPAEKEQPKAKKKPKPKQEQKPAETEPDETDDILLVMDSHDAEEKKVRLCPSCGAEFGEGDEECPECKFNPELEAGKKKKLRGSDPDGYVQNVWKESLQFLKSQKMLAFRSFLYTLIFTTITMGCLFMVAWCVKMPVRVFWGFLAIIMSLAAPGWAWLFNTIVIRTTVDPKDNEIRHVNFDFFAAVSMGINFLLWQIAMGIQLVFGIVGAVLISQGMTIPGLGCLAIAYALMLLLLPIAMGHLSMPIPFKGWKVLSLFKILQKTAKASITCVVIFVVTNLPALGAFAALLFLSGSEVKEFTDTVSHNSQVAMAFAASEAASESRNKTPEEEAAMDNPLAKEEPKELNFGVLIMPAILWFVVCLCFGVALPYNVRANSLLVLYCKRDFKLETKAKEKKYVSKQKQAEMKEEEKEAKRAAKAAKKKQKKAKKSGEG